MKEFAFTQSDYLLRVLVAALCGLVIGYEREARMKLAGIRTHTIIAMAASLMVVVSKYGFFDVITVDGISVDASRVAASVVSGIGFLGAGAILKQEKEHIVAGLTTAASIWVAAAVGIAAGYGREATAVASTVVALFVLAVLGRLETSQATNSEKKS